MQRWMPRRPDVLVAAALTVAGQVELWSIAPAGFPVAAVSAALAVGTVAFAWHRVAPLAALAVGYTALAVVPGALGVDPADFFGWFVTAIALMASAGYHARRPLAALAVGLGLLALSIVLQKGLVLVDVLYAWMLAGGAWLAGRTVANRTARAELSEQRAAAIEREAHWRAAAAVAEERLRIAREMHDIVSHSLSVMTLHVSGVRRLLSPDQTEQRAALELAERTGRESLAEMRRILGVLRDPAAADGAATADAAGSTPGLDRLPDLLGTLRAAGHEVSLEVTGNRRPLPAGVDLAAHRIVQEAVTNVLRHARARRVRVEVSYGAAVVELAVTDDGAGRADRGREDPSAAPGHGLVGMRERARAYGGSVTAGPATGGWAVRAVLPIPDDEVRRGPRTAVPGDEVSV